MGRKYLVTDIRLLPPEDLGRSVTLIRLAEIIAPLLHIKNEHAGNRESISRKVAEELGKSVRLFLKEDKARGRVLKKALIFELLADCLNNERPLESPEKEIRRNQKKESPFKNVKMPNVVPAKSCYRSELLFTLMFESGSPNVALSKNKKYMTKTEASEQISNWLFPIINGKQSTSKSLITKSQARIGAERASLAASIRRAYSRWNPYQLPDKPLGVYLPKSHVDSKTGKCSPTFSTKKTDVDAEKW